MADRKKLAMLGISILSAVLVIGGTIFYFGSKPDAPVEETAIVQETDIEVEEEITKQEEVVDWQLVRVEGVKLKTTSNTAKTIPPQSASLNTPADAKPAEKGSTANVTAAKTASQMIQPDSVFTK